MHILILSLSLSKYQRKMWLEECGATESTRSSQPWYIFKAFFNPHHDTVLKSERKKIREMEEEEENSGRERKAGIQKSGWKPY